MTVRGFVEIFKLEAMSLVRSKAFAMLLAFSVAWVVAMAFVATGDGTAEGSREVFVRYSLGGVFYLLVVALLSSATGSLATERAANRLQLAMVRPVRYFSIALAKAAALTACGAVVLAVSAVAVCFRTGVSERCSHVLKPVMPSPREEAEAMYKAYMADPNTPAAVRHASKGVVLRLLANRAIDRYDTVGTNETATWRFPLQDVAEASAPGAGLAVRARFTNRFDMRDEVRGIFRTGGLCGVASNITQAVVKVPLNGSAPAGEELSFQNLGASALIFRPRRDVELLVPADGFAANLARAFMELVAILALVISFGVFLSASLGRPVALFVAMVVLVVAEMSPSVVEQYPDELETKASDRIGLVMTRFMEKVTRPVSSLNPIERLATDSCVEAREVAGVIALDFVAVPVLLALVSAFVMPRKQE